MWAQIINTILGLWIMISPFLLHFENAKIADYNYITGPAIVSFSVIAYWQVSRAVGRWNIIAAVFLIIVTLFAGNPESLVGNIISCTLIIIMSFFKGKITQRFGGGWRSLFENNPEHLRYIN